MAGLLLAPCSFFLQLLLVSCKLSASPLQVSCQFSFLETSQQVFYIVLVCGLGEYQKLTQQATPGVSKIIKKEASMGLEIIKRKPWDASRVSWAALGGSIAKRQTAPSPDEKPIRKGNVLGRAKCGYSIILLIRYKVFTL